MVLAGECEHSSESALDPQDEALRVHIPPRIRSGSPAVSRHANRERQGLHSVGRLPHHRGAPPRPPERLRRRLVHDLEREAARGPGLGRGQRSHRAGRRARAGLFVLMIPAVLGIGE
jgi:hypothetical protein